VKTSFALFNERKNYDKVVFYMAHPYHFMPLVFTSLLKKKSLEVITWSTPTSKSFFSILFELQDRITFRILDGISPESKNLISNLKLEKYGNKVLSEGARFVNRSLKDSIIEYNSRDNIVGYIGRIRKEKGIVDFMKAIPLILEKNKDVKFLIVGDGDLIHWVKKEARNIIEEYNVEINVTGWIPEDKFAHYLCQLKLLVLPTNHAEGLPTIILESMFVEVPVLTTSVGAIPDVIIDECTGFFLQDTSPECIANGVMRALNNPKSDTIIHNARNLVENKYAYDAAVERFRLLINC
jgi:glycosyltransferase involved in cell wall biosynthesis